VILTTHFTGSKSKEGTHTLTALGLYLLFLPTLRRGEEGWGATVGFWLSVGARDLVEIPELDCEFLWAVRAVWPQHFSSSCAGPSSAQRVCIYIFHHKYFGRFLRDDSCADRQG